MLQEFNEWIGLVAAALSIGAIIYTWITAKSRTNAKTLEAHERKLIEHDRRIQKVENEVSHLPTKEDFTELLVNQERQNGIMARMEAEYRSLYDAVKSIDKFLRNGGSKDND